MKRIAFLVLGIFMLALGFVGAVLPVLPTTPFVIVAAGCFARSSPRLEAWLLAHPHLGPPLGNWRTHGAISPRAKRAAFIGMAIGFAVFLVAARPSWMLALLVAGLMGVGAAFVATRPNGPANVAAARDSSDRV
ncbi:YbaN family protein [Amorphus sp. 3PC139-8]|uniref:YbaN family protein n=1 Tax=Amorphus sp. 3PC139-8 TaxID=2735676 RepID=UPI00345D0A20